jgi:outer membrane immunogenic protein
MCGENLFQSFLGAIMLRISRWASIAIVVCGAALVGTAALAKPRAWQDDQSLSWAPARAIYDWTGFYVGAQVGGSFSGVGTSEFLAGTDIRTNHFHDTGSGFVGGANFGYDWQAWNKFVVGISFDVNGTNDKARHDFAGGSYIGATIDFTASALVRGGVLVTPAFLLYGQTGISIANQQLQIDFGGPETNESKIISGFTIGGGGEWKLPTSPVAFAKSTSLFVDYRHTFWNKATLSRPDASPFFDYAWCRDTDAINLGFRLRF